MDKHSPTPWKIEQIDESKGIVGVDGKVVSESLNGWMGEKQNKANAAFIVKCVNSHERMREFIEIIGRGYERERSTGMDTPPIQMTRDAMRLKALAILKELEK